MTESTDGAVDRATDRSLWARQNTVVEYLPHRIERDDRQDGTILLRSGYPLGEVVDSTGRWLHRWADEAPGRVAVAERDGDAWRELTYGELLEQVRAVAAGLLARGLDGRDAIAILSGNGIDHLLLSLAAQYVGIPIVPLAEQYSLISGAHPRLTYIIDKVRPKLAFAEDAGRYAQALSLPCLSGVEIVASKTGGVPGAVTPFADLLGHDCAGDAGAAIDAAHSRVGPDTLAKIMFTSGSSADPKGVLTTQRMLCVNQAQLRGALPFLGSRPPVVTDWLPWNHVFGGSHNVNMILANGGTLNIDLGKPAGPGFATTLKNRTERPGTLSFNVPAGFAMTVAAVAGDGELRRTLFGDLDLIFYAGASLPQNVWDRLEEYALETRGGLPLMISSWGMTETAPACLIVHQPIGRSGVIGVPMPGVEAKLVPNDAGRFELRVRGPNIMPGYYKDAEKTAQAFDTEGFLITGDAVRFVDPRNAALGLVYDGRVSEDFKLATGTWVQAGTLRVDLLRHLAGLAQDLVVCGRDRDEIGVLIFPAPARALEGDVEDGARIDPALGRDIAEGLRAANVGATGSARRIARALVLAEPPSVEGQEITDKGSLNINRILARRAGLLERLYSDDDPAVIRP
ncbi:MAG: feruloyl-CoA synthase [Nitratireductor sp.]|nr:feruloyl-CoA synthase [Nitratireductor sp.]